MSRVLVTGGANYADCALASAELYDPATGTWSVTGTLNAARGWHTATLLPNGDVLVAGACNDGIYCGSRNSCAELYNPATGTWRVTGELNTPRFYHAATLLPDGQVLIVGGEHINFFLVPASYSTAQRFITPPLAIGRITTMVFDDDVDIKIFRKFR